MGGVERYINKNKTNRNFRGSLASSFLEALVSGARPMEIVASTELISVSNVFMLFHYLLWKAELDLTALNEGLDSWSINVSFSRGSIASCGVMKTPSCIIHHIYNTIFPKNHKFPNCQQILVSIVSSQGRETKFSGANADGREILFFPVQLTTPRAGLATLPG